MANLQQPQAPEAPQAPKQEQGEKKPSWSEYGQQVYNEQYERWMPWIEDFYLRWFTKDNKASYATKDTLDKSKITGVKQIDSLQDGVHGLVSGQVGQDGLLQPVGDAFSREGINRAERQGKGEDGSYGPSGPAGKLVDPVAQGAGKVGGGIVDGGKAAGGYVGGLFGGGGGKK